MKTILQILTSLLIVSFIGQILNGIDGLAITVTLILILLFGYFGFIQNDKKDKDANS